MISDGKQPASSVDYDIGASKNCELGPACIEDEKKKIEIAK